MFIKLFRHEWKETWKIPAIITGAVVLLTAACLLYYSFQPVAGPDVELNVGSFILFMLFCFAVSSSSLLLTLYLGVRFYKNLYSDEGYLMHTLPVKPWMLIASKGLCATIWLYLNSLLIIIAILPLCVLAVPRMAYIEPTEIEVMSSYLMHMFGKSPLAIFFVLVPSMLCGSVFSILLIYASISLGQLFGRHKVISSILCYIGLQAIISTVTSAITTPVMTGFILTQAQDTEAFLLETMPGLFTTIYIVSFAVNLILSVAAFLLTNYVMSKNLNLD